MTENKKRYVYHQSRDFGSLIEDTKDNKCLHFMSQATEELNALHEERNYFERKKEEFLSKWSIANTENIQLRQENEQLKKEINKIKNILLNKKKDLECDYNRAAKAGMPTGGTIGELDTIEDILEEMGLKND